jgi:predicted ATPase
VALHPTLQRQLGAHLQRAGAQFVVITHSSELLPLELSARAQIVRFDRDQQAATRSWLLTDECRQRMSRKLMAKGN